MVQAYNRTVYRLININYTDKKKTRTNTHHTFAHYKCNYTMTDAALSPLSFEPKRRSTKRIKRKTPSSHNYRNIDELNDIVRLLIREEVRFRQFGQLDRSSYMINTDVLRDAWVEDETKRDTLVKRLEELDAEASFVVCGLVYLMFSKIS